MPLKLTDSEKVSAYMLALEHPLKAEIDAVREIIKSANANIRERIKWNAPSYYFHEDLVTFHTRPTKHVHLVFHHPHVTTIQSSLLEGTHKDRRMAYFRSMEEIQARKTELQSIIDQLVKHLEGASQ